MDFADAEVPVMVEPFPEIAAGDAQLHSLQWSAFTTMLRLDALH